MYNNAPYLCFINYFICFCIICQIKWLKTCLITLRHWIHNLRYKPRYNPVFPAMTQTLLKSFKRNFTTLESIWSFTMIPTCFCSSWHFVFPCAESSSQHIYQTPSLHVSLFPLSPLPLSASIHGLSQRPVAAVQLTSPRFQKSLHPPSSDLRAPCLCLSVSLSLALRQCLSAVRQRRGKRTVKWVFFIYIYTTRHPKTALAYKNEESAYLQFVAKVKSINML